MGIGNCGALIVEANLLLFQAMRLSAALTRLFGVSGPMPRDGSLILSDVRGPFLSLVREPCGRRGRYRVVRA